MPHAFAAHLFLCYFHTTSVAHDTLVANTFIFSAMTLVIFYRSEYTFAEKTVPLGFIGTVIDGFGFQDLTARIFQNLFGRSQTDRNLRKVTLYFVIFSKSHMFLMYKELLADCHISATVWPLDFIYSKLTLRPRPLNSCNNTFRDSGIPGVGMGSPLTIAS